MELIKKSCCLLFALLITFSFAFSAFAVADDAAIKDLVRVSDCKGLYVEGTCLNKEAEAVVTHTNTERNSYGRGSLTMDEDLTVAARQRALEISVHWSHDRPDGSSWDTVSDKVYAENIAYGQKDGEAVVYSWMHSKGHKTNLISKHYTKIGVAAVKIDDVIYWVQLFG